MGMGVNNRREMNQRPKAIGIGVESSGVGKLEIKITKAKAYNLQLTMRMDTQILI